MVAPELIRDEEWEQQHEHHDPHSSVPSHHAPSPGVALDGIVRDKVEDSLYLMTAEGIDDFDRDDRVGEEADIDGDVSGESDTLLVSALAWISAINTEVVAFRQPHAEPDDRYCEHEGEGAVQEAIVEVYTGVATHECVSLTNENMQRTQVDEAEDAA